MPTSPRQPTANWAKQNTMEATAGSDIHAGSDIQGGNGAAEMHAKEKGKE